MSTIREKAFPTRSREATVTLLTDIAKVVRQHFGFMPEALVLIVSDGEETQTLAAGTGPGDVTRALLEDALASHRRQRHRDGQPKH